MPILLGTNKIKNIWFGNSKVKNIWLGTNKIYSTTGRKLPDEYQKVEYIESTNTQYINTEVIGTEKTRIEIDFQLTGATTSQGLFGYRESASSNNNQFAFLSSGSSAFGFFLHTKPAVYLGKNIDNERHTISADSNEYYFDNNLISSFTSIPSFQTGNNLLLMAMYLGTALRRTYCKLYSCKLYDDSSLIRDFVPCYRKTDNVIGLYDMANDKFYTNAGSGTFRKGEDV